MNLEDESGIFVVIPNAWKAALRKDVDYKAARMGEVVYNGQVGTICGIPVIASKALTTEAFVMTKDAIKLFMKNDVEVEQDRDIEAAQANIDKLDKLFKAAVKAEVEKRLAGSAPKSGRGNDSEITKESAKKMSMAEMNELAMKNPELFSKLFS